MLLINNLIFPKAITICVHVEKPSEEKKKKLKDKCTLAIACLSLFGLPEQGSCIVQMYDKEFYNWLDVDDAMTVPHSGKLKIIFAQITMLN